MMVVKLKRWHFYVSVVVCLSLQSSHAQSKSRDLQREENWALKDNEFYQLGRNSQGEFDKTWTLNPIQALFMQVHFEYQKAEFGTLEVDQIVPTLESLVSEEGKPKVFDTTALSEKLVELLETERKVVTQFTTRNERFTRFIKPSKHGRESARILAAMQRVMLYSLEREASLNLQVAYDRVYEVNKIMDDFAVYQLLLGKLFHMSANERIATIADVGMNLETGGDASRFSRSLSCVKEFFGGHFNPSRWSEEETFLDIGIGNGRMVNRVRSLRPAGTVFAIDRALNAWQLGHRGIAVVDFFSQRFPELLQNKLGAMQFSNVSAIFSLTMTQNVSTIAQRIQRLGETTVPGGQIFVAPIFVSPDELKRKLKGQLKVIYQRDISKFLSRQKYPDSKAVAWVIESVRQPNP